jgi:ribonuclease P protein component
MESENAVPLPDSNRFPAKMRLIGSEFERVYKAKCSVSDGVLIVYAVANELGFSRLGLTVSRKVGPAHQRNRWKRSIREAFRTRLSALPIGFDYAISGPTQVNDGAAVADEFGPASRQEV